MSKRTIRLTESDLHNIIKESVNTILKEDSYLYNGEEYRKKLMQPYKDKIEKERIYKENIKYFEQAFKNISKEYNIIKKLKRNNYEALRYFSTPTFILYVKEYEGDSLYEKIWERYGGEYEEVADQYIFKGINLYGE